VRPIRGPRPVRRDNAPSCDAGYESVVDAQPHPRTCVLAKGTHRPAGRPDARYPAPTQPLLDFSRPRTRCDRYPEALSSCDKHQSLSLPFFLKFMLLPLFVRSISFVPSYPDDQRLSWVAMAHGSMALGRGERWIILFYPYFFNNYIFSL
jgi:hypothetical protein